MRYGSIYTITNKTNGKKYVGQTIFNVSVRWDAHKNKINKNTILSKAFFKYGVSNFIFEEVCSCSSKEDLNAMERFFIKNLNTVSPFGYNQTEGGDSNIVFTEEVRHKMRIARLGKKFGPRQKTVNSSGSTENKNSEHAQRLEGETAKADYNPSTSPRLLSKYVAQKDSIIELYLKYNSTYKVAAELNLDKSHVGRWLKTWGVLKTQSEAASQRNINKYAARDQFKEKIYELMALEKSRTEIARILNIPYNTIRNWQRIWKSTEKKI